MLPLYMQLSLPFFTADTTLITSILGVFVKNKIVYYLLNGLPIYSHKEGDQQAFRFFTANLVHIGLCRKTDIMRTFSITIDQVNRACKLLELEGESGFFKPENRHGHCHKLVGENHALAQKLLDEGKSNCEVGRQCHVRESAVRYSISKGYLKKKLTH